MIYVGIDGGGSKTSVVATTAAEAKRFSYSGIGTNPQRVGLDACIETICDLLRDVRRGLNASDPLRVVAGIAGAGRPDEQQLIASRITETLTGDSRVVVTHDADIALDAAFGVAAGTIVIAGTGSVVLSRDEHGQQFRVGGWGYLLGDEGSGTALGLEAIRAVCRALDGGPHTALVQLTREQHGFIDRDHLIAGVYRQQWPAQSGARMVLEAAAAGDDVASDILRSETVALARQVEWLYRRHPHLPPRYVPIGGLASESLYAEAFEEAMTTLLPTWQRADPVCSPPEAALLRALRME